MNFIVCQKETLFNSYYIYIDKKQGFADVFFKQNNIKVKSRKEWDYPNTDYKIVYASVSNQKDYLFVKSMCELEDALIEKGYIDYEKSCKKLFSVVTSSKKKVKKCII